MYIKCRYIPPSIYFQEKSHTLPLRSRSMFFSVTQRATYYQSKNMFSHYFIFEKSPFNKSNLIKTWSLYWFKIIKKKSRSKKENQHHSPDFYLGSLWVVYEQSLGSLWSVFGQSLGSLWAIFGQSLGSLWAVCGEFVGSLLAVRGQPVDSRWTVGGRRGQSVGSLWAVIVDKYLIVDKKFHCFVCGLSIQYSCLIDIEKVDSILRYLMTPSPRSALQW